MGLGGFRSQDMIVAVLDQERPTLIGGTCLHMASALLHLHEPLGRGNDHEEAAERVKRALKTVDEEKGEVIY